MKFSYLFATVTSALCLLGAVLLLLVPSTSTWANTEGVPGGVSLSAPTESVTLPAAADAYISNRSRSDAVSNFGSTSSLSVEMDEFTLEQRTLIRFDTSSIPPGSVINAATLRLYQTAADSAKQPWAIWAYQVNEPWEELKVTWNSRPATDTLVSLINTNEDLNKYFDWDVTSIVNRWVHDAKNTPNYGLELRAQDAGLLYFRRYNSRENSANAPQLVIDYTPPPTVAAIPRDDKQPVDIDNVCMLKEEYANAAAYRYNDIGNNPSNLYLKHDGKNLYVCVEGVWGELEERFFAVNLDRNLGQEQIAQKEDVSLRAAVTAGKLSSYRGTGSAAGPWVEDDIRGWTASAGVVNNLEREVAEFQIPLELTTATCGQPFGLGIYHQSVGTAGDYFGWPAGENPNHPMTWVTARLVDPESCPSETPTTTATPTATTVITQPTGTPTTTATEVTAPPTATPTATSVATSTATPTSSATSTATAKPTRTPKPTWTPIPSPTSTPGPSPTPLQPILALPYQIVREFTVIRPIVLPDLAIHGIELTQGVQCFDTSRGLAGCADNSLPLVAKKNSTARIYLKYNGGLGNSLSNVPVRLYIRANGVWYQANVSGKATQSINQANSDSANVYFNVNFTNDVVVDFYAEVDPNGTISESNESNNRFPATGFITKRFDRSQTLDIVGQRLDYHPTGYTGTRRAGGWAVNGGAADYFEQLLPIRTNGVDYSVKSGYLDWTKNLSSGDNQHDLIKTLNAYWILQNAFSWLFGTGAFTGAEHVYGWAPNSGYSGGHADMPVYPHAGGLGVVGIGTDRPGTSTNNPGGGALIMAHELLHDYDLKHTDTGGDDCGSNDSSSAFPYGTSSIQEFGFNPITGKIYNPSNTHDVLSYCPAGGSKEGWTSPYTWNYMHNRITAQAISAAAQRNIPQVMRTTAVSESLVVNVTIFNPNASTFNPDIPGELGNLYRVPGGIQYAPLPGDYAVQLRNKDGVLATQSFKVDFESEYDPAAASHPGHGDDAHQDPPFPAEPASRADLSFIMPWATGTTTVTLIHNDTVLDERAVSGSAPVVTITSPSAEVTWVEGTVESIKWEASDADAATGVSGPPLSYSVLYSIDGGASWSLLATDLLETAYFVAVDGLAGSSDARFRVVATDGVNIGSDETDAAIIIPNKAPAVSIIAPFNGLVIGADELLVLYGSASDLEDGNIADEALTWSSDRQGSLGIGSSVALNTLESGAHVLMLTGRDKFGASASASVNVFIGEQVFMPLIAR